MDKWHQNRVQKRLFWLLILFLLIGERIFYVIKREKAAINRVMLIVK